jgi:hypothetical protein
MNDLSKRRLRREGLRRVLRGSSLGAVGLVGLVLGALLQNATHREPTNAGSPRHPTLEWRADAPFFGAVAQPSIEAAENALGWNIYRPSNCAANDQRIEVIYVNVENDQAYVRYKPVGDGCPGFGAGKVEIEASVPDFAYSSDAVGVAALASLLEEHATALGPVASVELISGLPVLVLQGNYPGDCDNPLPTQQGCVPAGSNNPTSVKMQVGGIAIDIYAPGEWTKAQILEVAASIASRA